MITFEQIRFGISRFPRVRLANLPTPLHECPRLARYLGGPRIWIKRDDLTGLALGGNKVRSLEFSLADALKLGADLLLAGSGVQSNYCRLAAAAAAQIDLPCHLILARTGQEESDKGNLLLDRLLGAEVELVPVELGEELDQELERREQYFRKLGRRPYNLLNPSRYYLLAGISYVEGFIETMEQLDEVNLHIDFIYHSAAGPTQAGLIAGARLCGRSIEVKGISPIRWQYDLKTRIARTAHMVSSELGAESYFSPEEVFNTDEFVGESYGTLTAASLEAIRLMARLEGILLDPIYTGRALAALIEDVRTGLLRPEHNVLFLHTGGVPSLFAYDTEISRLLSLT